MTDLYIHSGLYESDDRDLLDYGKNIYSIIRSNKYPKELYDGLLNSPLFKSHSTIDYFLEYLKSQENATGKFFTPNKYKVFRILLSNYHQLIDYYKNVSIYNEGLPQVLDLTCEITMDEIMRLHNDFICSYCQNGEFVFICKRNENESISILDDTVMGTSVRLTSEVSSIFSKTFSNQLVQNVKYRVNYYINKHFVNVNRIRETLDTLDAIQNQFLLSFDCKVSEYDTLQGAFQNIVMSASCAIGDTRINWDLQTDLRYLYHKLTNPQKYGKLIYSSDDESGLTIISYPVLSLIKEMSIVFDEDNACLNVRIPHSHLFDYTGGSSLHSQEDIESSESNNNNGGNLYESRGLFTKSTRL